MSGPTEPNQAHLENWFLVGDPEVRACLFGNVYGHPHLTDGKWIRTSGIKHIDSEAGVAETMNTVYTLGQPNFN